MCYFARFLDWQTPCRVVLASKKVQVLLVRLAMIFFPYLRSLVLLMAEIRRSPVEVGSWNPIIYDGFFTSQVVGLGISEPSTVSFKSTWKGPQRDVFSTVPQVSPGNNINVWCWTCSSEIAEWFVVILAPRWHFSELQNRWFWYPMTCQGFLGERKTTFLKIAAAQLKVNFRSTLL